MSKKELNPKQRRFCEEYLIDSNGAQAAIRAGYSPRGAKQRAHTLMSNPAVRDYLDDRMESLQQDAIADQTEVLQALTQVLRGTRMGSALVGVGKGEQEIDEMPPTNTEIIKAAELLGKRYGIWEDKKTVDVNTAVSFIDDIG